MFGFCIVFCSDDTRIRLVRSQIHTNSSQLVMQSTDGVLVSQANWIQVLRFLKSPQNLIMPFFLSSETRVEICNLKSFVKKLFFSGGSFFCKFPPSTDQLRVFSHLFLTAKPDCLDQGRASSFWPESSARWFPPRPRCEHRAAWRWGSQGRRGRPAKPSTPVSAAPLLSTWEDQKICNAKFGFKKCLKEIFFMFLAFSSPLSSA